MPSMIRTWLMTPEGQFSFQAPLDHHATPNALFFSQTKPTQVYLGAIASPSEDHFWLAVTPQVGTAHSGLHEALTMVTGRNDYPMWSGEIEVQLNRKPHVPGVPFLITKANHRSGHLWRNQQPNYMDDAVKLFETSALNLFLGTSFAQDTQDASYHPLDQRVRDLCQEGLSFSEEVISPLANFASIMSEVAHGDTDPLGLSDFNMAEDEMAWFNTEVMRLSLVLSLMTDQWPMSDEQVNLIEDAVSIFTTGRLTETIRNRAIQGLKQLIQLIQNPTTKPSLDLIRVPRNQFGIALSSFPHHIPARVV